MMQRSLLSLRYTTRLRTFLVILWPKYLVKFVDRKHGLHWLGPRAGSGWWRYHSPILRDFPVPCWREKRHGEGSFSRLEFTKACNREVDWNAEKERKSPHQNTNTLTENLLSVIRYFWSRSQQSLRSSLFSLCKPVNMAVQLLFLLGYFVSYFHQTSAMDT